MKTKNFLQVYKLLAVVQNRKHNFKIFEKFYNFLSLKNLILIYILKVYIKYFAFKHTKHGKTTTR